MLILRTTNSEGKSYSDFQWPLKVGASVEAPDWNPEPQCGNGLHGLLWGAGAGSLLDWYSDAKWLVVEIDEYVDLDGKVKFPRGVVVHVGDQISATSYIYGRAPRGTVVVGASVLVGRNQFAAVGYKGTATAGDGGNATAGYKGAATAGYGGTATAGYKGTATAGKKGTLRIEWWDNKTERYRWAIGYVGENGIEPNVAYRVNDRGEFIKAEAR